MTGSEQESVDGAQLLGLLPSRHFAIYVTATTLGFVTVALTAENLALGPGLAVGAGFAYSLPVEILRDSLQNRQEDTDE